MVLLAAISLAVVFSVNARRPEDNAADFYDFWEAAHWFRQGRDIYFGGVPRGALNLNAPATILLFLPFSYLPLVVAHQAFTALGVATFAVVSRWVAQAFKPRAWLLIASLLFVSQGTFAALQLGQPSWLLAFVLTAAWLADRQDRPFKSGFLLGLAAAAKPFLGLYAVYAATRDRRMFAGMCLGGAAFLLAGLAAGPGAYPSWIAALGHVDWSAHLANGSLLGLVNRALVTPPDDLATTPLTHAPALVTPVWLALCAVATGLALRAHRREADLDRRWLSVGMLSLLLSPLGWDYYVPMFIGPLWAAVVRGSRAVHLALLTGYVLHCVPYTLLVRDLGALGTITVGSPYTWGTIAFFAASLPSWGARRT